MIRYLFIVPFLLPLMSVGQQVERNIVFNGEQIGFLEYLPAGYNNDTQTKFPLIIFLHGIGERGNGTSELWKVKRIGIPAYIDRGETMRFQKNGQWHTFIVLSPQCPKKFGMWPTDYVDAMIEYAGKSLRIDKKRIYLTGLSMGGGGTWRFASSSEKNAKKLAAIATVCAPMTLTNGCHIASARLPMWSFHATDDEVVNISDLYNAVNRVLGCKPAIEPKTTVWATGGHQIWNWAFDTKHNYQAPNLFEWFLDYKRDDPDDPHPGPVTRNKPPIAIAGADRVAQSPHNFIRLVGTQSVDKDGWIRSFTWSKVYGPDCNIEQPDAGATRITGLLPGIYRFRLTVRDNRGALAYDDVIIRMNMPPVMRTTPDKIIYLPDNAVYLQSTRTTDPDYGGWIQSFRWIKIGGPPQHEFENANTGSTWIRGLVQGNYTFRVIASDGHGGQSHKDIVVQVQPRPRQRSFATAEIKAAFSQKAVKNGVATVHIAPNPASSSINVQCASMLNGNATITFTDITGRILTTIMCKKSVSVLDRTVDVSRLSRGIYFVTIDIAGKNIAVHTFLKL